MTEGYEMTTTTETMKPVKRPHTTSPRSPRFRQVVPATGAALACMICGDWTPTDEQHETERVRSEGHAPTNAIESVRASSRNGAIGQPFETTMTRCRRCLGRRQRAERLAAMYPEAARVGKISYLGRGAVDAIERVLAVCALVEYEFTVRRSRDLSLAVEHLSVLGGAVRWRSRFEGIAEVGAQSDTAASIPWAHLSRERRGEVRYAVAGYLRARVERPVPVRPSTAEACYICGIGELDALPSQAGEIWQAARVNPSSLGGSHGGERVDTEVCRACHDEAEMVGMYGPTMLDRLVLRAAGIERKLGADLIQLRGVCAWGTSGRRQANARPFDHLDLQGLARQYRQGRL